MASWKVEMTIGDNKESSSHEINGKTNSLYFKGLVKLPRYANGEFWELTDKGLNYINHFNNVKLGVVYIKFSKRLYNSNFEYFIDISKIMIFKKYQRFGIFKELLNQLSNNDFCITRNIYIENVINDKLKLWLDTKYKSNNNCYFILNN